VRQIHRPSRVAGRVGPVRSTGVPIPRRSVESVTFLRSPSSSGLGHRPFKAAARVRIPLGILLESASDQEKRKTFGLKLCQHSLFRSHLGQAMSAAAMTTGLAVAVASAMNLTASTEVQDR
jgi:hypothetical protein